MEAIGPMLLIPLGIALLFAAALVGKKKYSEKSRDQRRAEVYCAYDKQMDRFRR